LIKHAIISIKITSPISAFISVKPAAILPAPSYARRSPSLAN
jgi:hypothetical protein